MSFLDSLESDFGLGSSSSDSSSSMTTYLEYGGIAIGVVILAVLIKKMI
jgi:hypothetical protein